jgi:hypothetical protein
MYAGFKSENSMWDPIESTVKHGAVLVLGSEGQRRTIRADRY